MRKKKVPKDEFEEFETAEEKKERQQRKKSQEQDVDELPETGLYTSEGYLFYHTNPTNLTRAQLKRASEHMINLRSGKFFSLEESVQIFRNWKEFAENHKLKLEMAEEYVSAKKTDKHLRQHQSENHFWPKFCHGLPHRSADHVKRRAETMMTMAFMKELNWDELEAEIHKKYYTYDKHDELKVQKAKQLFDRGYVASHVGELLDISSNQATSLQTKLNAIEKREDSVMVHSFFKMATKFGLDMEKLREHLIASDEDNYTLLRKSFSVTELSIKIHMTKPRVREFLKKYMTKIWDKFHEIREDDERTDEEKLEEAMQIIAEKPPLTDEQVLRALEIICQKIEKNETSADLIRRNDVATAIKEYGITDFSCAMPEYSHIHQKITDYMMNSLDAQLFVHLRRKFPLRVKLHVLLWSLKRAEWEKLTVKKGETRYEVIMRHELPNPLMSRLTKKMLKNALFVEWISEPRLFKDDRFDGSRRRQIAVELFIIYCHQKYGTKFKYPAKLRQWTAAASGLIERLLDENENNNPDEKPNHEYLTSKEVRKVVETATNSKILTKLTTKKIMAKIEVSESESSDDSDVDNNSEDVEKLQKIAMATQEDWRLERKRELEELLEKADQARISKKYKKLVENLDLKDADFEFSEAIWKKQMEMKKLAEEWKLRKKERSEKRKKAEPVYKSREFIETSDSSSDEEDSDAEDSEDVEGRVSDDSEVPEEPLESEDVLVPEKRRKSKEPDSHVSEESEHLVDVGISKKHKKSKKRRHEEDSEAPEDPVDSENVETSKKDRKSKKRRFEEGSEVSEKSVNLEDVEISNKHKKSKKRRFEADSETSGEPVDSEDVNTSKKDRKSKKRRISESSEAPESSDDVPKSEKVKNFKNGESEVLEAPEDLEVPEDVENSKKSKKRRKSKHREALFDGSEIPVAPEDSEVPEDVGSSKKLKKHRKSDHRDPEEPSTSESHEKRRKSKKHDSAVVVEDSEAPEDSEDVVSSKRHTKSKKRNLEDVENTEDVRVSKKKEKKKRRRLDSEDVTLDSEDQESSEKRKKKKKKKDSEEVDY